MLYKILVSYVSSVTDHCLKNSDCLIELLHLCVKFEVSTTHVTHVRF